MPLPAVPLIVAGLAGAGVGGALMGIFGGGNEAQTESVADTNINIQQDQHHNNWNITTDNSVNIVANSPFGGIKKGEMGRQANTASQNAVPTATTTQTPTVDQSTDVDMTGLIFLAIVAGLGIYAYKEFVD